jgi:Ca2+-dependent lipid-binding protein
VELWKKLPREEVVLQLDRASRKVEPLRMDSVTQGLKSPRVRFIRRNIVSKGKVFIAKRTS